MSNNGTLLPIPAGSELEATVADLTAAWPQLAAQGFTRSVWLTAAERVLQTAYPSSSSADRKLTARHVAPFPLALGPNVV